MTSTALLGARNPRALAEAVLGRPIDWNEVADEPAFLEDVLATPYEQLFDPKFDSPVYLGLRRSADGLLTQARPDFLDQSDPDPAPSNDVDRFPAHELDSVER